MMSASKKWTLGAVVVIASVASLYAPPAYGGINEHKLVFKGSFGAGLVKNPMGVAVNEKTGDVYVGDFSNNRVDEFGPAGAFILTFGKDVNETTGGNICTQAEIETSSVTCKAGVAGEAAGQLSRPASVAVDQATGNVFVTDNANFRVDEFDAGGHFVLTIGGNVNKTAVAKGGSEVERNTCTQAEIEAASVECQKGESSGSLPAGSTPHGQFEGWATFRGNSLAVGGPNHLLYVADKARVQELKPSTGHWQAELSVASLALNERVNAMTIDGLGDVYAVVGGVKGVHEFDSSDKELQSIDPQVESIFGLAFDSADHIALVEEASPGAFAGALYASTGSFLSHFAPPAGMGRTTGLAFNNANELYTSDQGKQEIDTYKPVPAAELGTKPLACVAGAPQGTSVTFNCQFNGTVDAWGVPGTEAWFQWGTTPALGQETQPKQQIANNKLEGEEEAIVPVSSSAINGLRPNETIYYQTASTDKNDEGEAPLTSTKVSEATPIATPTIVGNPKTLTVRPSSAVFSGELNPQNAPTEYAFEYGACETLEHCASAGTTNALLSSAYGNVATTLEAKELRPGTTYRYRLVAVNKKMQEALGPEASFTTTPEPVPTATTALLPDSVSATSATISGTVEPHGWPSDYTFELGVDNGAGTQYVTVLSGSAGASEGAVNESVALVGLQPGTRYLYKITAEDSYGRSEGLPEPLETESVSPGLLVPETLAQLPVPDIKLPTAGKPPLVCKKGFKRNKLGRCVKVPRKKGTQGKRKKGTQGKRKKRR